VSGADVAELRKRLTDPRLLCTALGLLDGYKPGRQARGGLLIRCPAHGEREPSCSVRRGRDGTIQVRCFSCDFGGDALSLVAAARGLDPRHQFGAVLSEAARLAGYSLESSRGDGHPPAPPRGESPPADPSREKNSSPQPPPEPPAYPDEREVADVWAASRTIEGDEQARAYLASRAIDPVRVAALDLARVLPVDFTGPSWARYQGKPWAAAGYRLLVPMVDAHGALRSLRAWRLAGSGEAPKRVAPAGKAMAGLVMACPIARSVLQTGQSPAREPLDVVITEGEPDFLTHATRSEGSAAPAVVGVVASAWSSAVADRLPGDARIVIRTHRDAAGDRYAADIRSSLADRVPVLDFSRPSDPSMKLPDDNDDAQTGELHSYLDNIEPAGVPRTIAAKQVNPSDTWSTVGALVERLRNAPAKLHTGIENIDDGWRGGAPAGLVWVIGGAPGAGKTTWVTNLGHEWALHGVPVAYVAGDEAREGILIRLGQQAGIDRKYLEEGAPVALDDLEKHLQELPMLLVDPDEDVGVDVATVATALRRRWPVEGPAVIIIDSLQAMARRIPDDVSDTPRAKVDAFMKSCKAAAKRHQLVIICLSELARGAYRGGNDQTNDLAAAKESGAIEYEAGALCVLRPVEEEPGLVTVSWAKSRPGRVEPFAIRINHKTATVSVEEPPSKKKGTPEEGDAAYRELLDQVAQTVRRNQGTGGVPGVEAVAARMVPGRRRSAVRTALDELLETGVLQNLGDRRRPRFFWVKKDTIEGGTIGVKKDLGSTD